MVQCEECTKVHFIDGFIDDMKYQHMSSEQPEQIKPNHVRNMPIKTESHSLLYHCLISMKYFIGLSLYRPHFVLQPEWIKILK